MMRSVPCPRPVIQEERLLGRVDMCVHHELDRVVGQILAEVVAVLRRTRLRDRSVVLGQVGIPLIRLAAEEAVVPLEPPAQRPAMERTSRRVVLRRGQVPLTDAERVVAVLQQHLRQHPVLEWHAAVIARVAGRELHDARHAVRVVVATGQDARPCRGTQRRRVHVRVAQPLRGHTIDIRRLDEPAEARQLTVPHVVEHEKENIRRAIWRPRRRRPSWTRLLNGPADCAGKLAAGPILLDAAHLSPRPTGPGEPSPLRASSHHPDRVKSSCRAATMCLVEIGATSCELGPPTRRRGLRELVEQP